MHRRDTLKGMIAAGISSIAFPAFAQQGRFVLSKIALLDGRVVMPITIKGQGPYLFLLDTGAPGIFAMNYAMARKIKLWGDTRPYALQASFGIAGSGGIDRIIRVETLYFGGQLFKRPLILLHGQDSGIHHYDGLSGLWLSQNEQAIIVADVGTGSPAAAGIKVGDIISGTDFRTAIATITGPAGKEIELRIRSSGNERTIAFTLTPFLYAW